MENKLKAGDIVRCRKYGKNNSEVLQGHLYTIDEVDNEGMLKLIGHPDWWSSTRFSLSQLQTHE